MSEGPIEELYKEIAPLKGGLSPPTERTKGPLPRVDRLLPVYSRITLYKHKSPSFSERSVKRVKVKKNPAKAPTLRCVECCEEIAQLLCENRLHNVLSKLPISLMSEKPPSVVSLIYTGKLLHDAMEEYCSENEIKLARDEKKFIGATLHSLAKNVVSSVLEAD